MSAAKSIVSLPERRQKEITLTKDAPDRARRSRTGGRGGEGASQTALRHVAMVEAAGTPEEGGRLWRDSSRASRRLWPINVFGCRLCSGQTRSYDTMPVVAAASILRGAAWRVSTSGVGVPKGTPSRLRRIRPQSRFAPLWCRKNRLGCPRSHDLGPGHREVSPRFGSVAGLTGIYLGA